MHKVCTKAILLGERSVRIREVKGSNPSRSTKQFVLEPDSLRKRVRVRFFVYRRFCGKSTQSGKQERIKAGYHRGDGILPLFCGIKFALGAIAAYVRTESLYISGEV